MTLRDVLEKPVQAPRTPAEIRVAEHLIRQLLDSNEEQLIRVATRGQVNACLVH